MATAISTEDLSKSYGSTNALVSLNLEVRQGEVIGYLGPNGAGKTTTIRLLLGLTQPTAGRAEIFGVDCQTRPGAGAPPAGLRARRGQPVAVADRGPRRCTCSGASTARVDTAYRDALVERFEFDPSKRVRAYSKGNRQKLC